MKSSHTQNRRGALSTEYGLMAALVALIVVASVAFTGDGVKNSFEKIETQMTAALSGTPAPAPAAPGNSSTAPGQQPAPADPTPTTETGTGTGTGSGSGSGSGRGSN